MAGSKLTARIADLRYPGRRRFVTAMSSLAAAVVTMRTGAAYGKARASLSTPFRTHGNEIRLAPFGNQVSARIDHYNRLSPYIASAGLLHRGGLQHARDLGFKTLVDLRGADEKGVGAEAKIARQLGLPRLHLPVTSRAPTAGQVSQFAELVEDAARYPILVHCVSANRVGAMWALYRASVGVNPTVAVEEGKAAGLASREDAVRARLGLSGSGTAEG